ncbi:MAG: flagellar biosynthetic protein FliO [Syntrophobacter sp.]
MDFGLQLLRVVGSLALVLALFFAIVYGLRKWAPSTRRSSPQKAMEVLSKHSFGPRHHLMLVKIPGGRNVLVGISPQNISLLTAERDTDDDALPMARPENV